MKKHVLLLILLLTYVLFSILPPAALAAAVCGTWNFVPSAKPSSTFSAFVAVTAISNNDAWAVGLQANSNNVFQTLAEHWDGRKWTIVPTPNLGTTDNALEGVVAFAPDDVWAAGWSSDFGKPQSLIIHWNGSTWQIVPTPTNPYGAFLDSILKVSASEMWAVGGQGGSLPDPALMTLTLHWDGSAWSVVQSPNVANRTNQLQGASLVAPDDIWAVGTARNTAELYTPLTLHWDGSTWSVVSAPTEGIFTQLFNTTAFGPDDVWATGIGSDENSSPVPYFLHWNGSAWNPVPTPGGVQPFFGGRNGLASLAANDLWSVGDSLVHWDGQAWSLVAGADIPNATDSTLLGAATIGSCDVWAVGSYYAGATFPLVERLQAVALSSLKLAPAKVKGGNPVTGTITLTAPAPKGGMKVRLSSSNPAVASVPKNVTVAEGSATAMFTVKTMPVGGRTVVNINAFLNGVKKTARLVVQP